MLDKKQLFNEISIYYDRMNTIISLGMHYYIKKQSVKLLDIKKNAKILDLCTGTGDIVQIISKYYKNINITGVDNAENMLEIARLKNKGINFIYADVTNLPFKDNEFDYITMAFGLRNVENRKKALDEIKRVLKPDGFFLHLDFGNHNVLSKFFDIFVLSIIEILKINAENYKYLIKSKNIYPEPDELIKEFENNGFKFIKRKDYLLGSISAQVFS